MSKNLSYPNTTYFSNGVQVDTYMLFNAAATALSGSSTYGLYMDSSYDLYWWNGSSSTKVNSSGGGGTGGGLDSAYSVGGAENSITVDEGAITFTDATAGALNTMEFVKSGAGTGNILDFAVNTTFTGNVIDIDLNAGVGAKGLYIDGGGGTRTAVLADFKHDGDGNVAAMNFTCTNTGTGAVLSFVMNGVGSDAGVINIDLNAAVGAEAIYIDAGGGTRTADEVSIKHDGDGNVDVFAIVSTNTGTGAIFDINMDGAGSTAGVFNVDMNAAVGAEFLYLDVGAGIRTANLIEIKYDGAGAVDCFAIVGTDTSSGHIFDIDMGGIHTGNVIDIDMDAAVGAKAIYIDGGAGTRTADAINVKHDGNGNTDVFSVDATNTGTGSIFDINMAGNGSNAGVFNIDMDAAVGAEVFVIDGGAGTRTVDMFDILMDGDGNVGVMDITVTNTGSGNIIEIDVDAIHTGNALVISYGTAAATGDAVVIEQGTNVSGSALNISAAGARTDDLIKIDDTSTGNSHIFDINMGGAYTGNVIDCAFASTATGKFIAVDMNAAVGATAIYLDAGNATRTVDLIDILMDGDGDVGVLDITVTNTGSGNILEVDIDSVHTGSALLISYGTGAATGDAITLTMGTNVAGRGIAITSAATGTSGEGAAIDITHTGNLAAGADVVNITSSGSPSSTSNLLAIEQATGAGTAGAYGLYINCTGTNVEAIKVDAGAVVLDEALSVGTTLAVTGAATFTAGQQSAAVARTVTADGLTTGLIADGTTYVTVTSDSADKILTLPTPTPGNVVWAYESSAVGYELRSSTPASIAINGGTGVAAESAVGAGVLIRCVCTSATTWVCNTFAADGTEAKLEAAAP